MNVGTYLRTLMPGYQVFEKGDFSQSLNRHGVWQEDGVHPTTGNKRIFIRCPWCSRVYDIGDFGFQWFIFHNLKGYFGFPMHCVACRCQRHYNVILTGWEKPHSKVEKALRHIRKAMGDQLRYACWGGKPERSSSLTVADTRGMYAQVTPDVGGYYLSGRPPKFFKSFSKAAEAACALVLEAR